MLGRLISDNRLLGNEVSHFILNKRFGDGGGGACLSNWI